MSEDTWYYIQNIQTPVGPVSREKIVELLQQGFLNGESLVWSQDLPDWKYIRDIDELRSAVILPPPPLSYIHSMPFEENEDFGYGTHHPWRRFFARTVDELFFGLIFFFLFYFVSSFVLYRLNPEYANNLLKIFSNRYISAFILQILWIPSESLFVCIIGATPAKWLFGIRVLDFSRNRLSFWASLKRALLVITWGEGCGLPIVILITRLCAYSRLNKTGSTFWDESANSIVIHRRWGFFRAFFCTSMVIATFCLIAFLSVIGHGNQ